MTDTTMRTIEQRVRIAASPATVWSFWTDAQRLVEWWGSIAEVEPQPGGIFRIVMGDGGPVMRGEYVELEPHTRLVFSFGWEQNAPGEAMAPGSSTVEVTLTADGDDTELLLRHSQVPAAFAPEHAQGWEHYVGELLPAAVAAAHR
jgi:uncharacterized protein YndB with AHSA1/START domain